MSSLDDKRKKPDKSYGRKPYIIVNSDDKSYDNLMNTVPRKAMLDQRLEQKSVFDKPYLIGSNYQEMEYGQPPQVPSFITPDFEGRSGPYPVPPEMELPAPGGVCALVCFPPLYCDGPVECHFAIISGISEGALYS